MTQAGLSKQGLIDFFNSLGTTDVGNNILKTIVVSNCPGWPYLTDADKQIATDKGYILS